MAEGESENYHRVVFMFLNNYTLEQFIFRLGSCFSVSYYIVTYNLG